MKLFPASFRTLVSVVLATVVLTSVAEEVATGNLSQWRRPDTIPFPADNRYTPEKAALGKMLFFDSRLSRDRNLSCASCHNPSFGWEVPFAKAIGAGGKPLGRHAPTALNQAWSQHFFWDGRAGTLEAQAKGPITAPVEMDLPIETAVARLKEVQGYVKAFDKAFPKEGITEATLLKAIATFERTLVTGDTRFDKWVRGDAKALSESEKRGFSLFTGKANCMSCHSGWNFTDDKFHDIGLASDDIGREGVTKAHADKQAFKTPGLREIAARAPYMHDGSVASLEGVIAHYMTGGQKRESLSPLMKPLQLNEQDIKDLAAFLRTLSSPQATMAMPNLPAL